MDYRHVSLVQMTETCYAMSEFLRRVLWRAGLLNDRRNRWMTNAMLMSANLEGV